MERFCVAVWCPALDPAEPQQRLQRLAVVPGLSLLAGEVIVQVINWVTVSWVATASSSRVESNARRRFPVRIPVASTTARTASAIRSGD